MLVKDFKARMIKRNVEGNQQKDLHEDQRGRINYESRQDVESSGDVWEIWRKKQNA